MLRYMLLSTLLMSATVSAQDSKPGIPPGQYVLEHDRGTLTIRQDKLNKLSFEIESIGSNAHTCSVSGVITGTIGRAASSADDENEAKCEISFTAIPTAIEVQPITEEACRGYCGMRASFDGTYRIPPASCTSASQKKQRDRFSRLYRARQYPQAEDTLNTLIAQCQNFMDWVTIDRVRNDLALAQYHNGQAQQCLTTLNTTLAAKVKNEEELKSGNGEVYLPPMDFDLYIDVAKSTWFNQTLCSKALEKKR